MLTSVTLNHLPGGGRAYLRELCGHDEMAVSGTQAHQAVALLDRLLADAPGAAVGAGSAVRLAVPDRDRLLAAVYSGTYGDRIGSTLHCGDCERPFDMDFSLAELVNHLGTESGTDAGDRVRLPDGRSCRLPTGEDEIAVADLAPEQAALALADRLLTGGTLSAPSDEDGLAALQRHLAERAPVLDLDLEAACPECGAGQPVRFDIQSYLLTSLLQEQERLVYEVHRLARAYGWHLDEILGLPRRLRRRHVGLIEAEIEAAGRD